MGDDTTRYRELEERYSSYGDEELLELGQGIDDLTEMAQEALKGELTRRHLKVEAGRPDQPKVLSEEQVSSLQAYAALAPAECTFEFEDRAEASAASLALEEVGIESVILAAGGSTGFDMRGPRVVVAPQDAERAEAILSQPLAERFREESGAGPAEFALPCCPACGSEETLLEGVDPANAWRCEGCGETWEETVAPE
jgi:hypothetical protein